ncbi:hypothetical protein E9Y09_RS13715 [Escherichia coli]|nr:hypothetical protein [Escherichia coli]
MTLKIFLLLIVKMGGVMRDDRFNSLKKEFDGAPDDAGDALSSISELIRAAFFLLGTKEYKSTGIDVLNITADYAEYIAESELRKMSGRG